MQSYINECIYSLYELGGGGSRSTAMSLQGLNNYENMVTVVLSHSNLLLHLIVSLNSMMSSATGVAP